MNLVAFQKLRYSRPASQARKPSDHSKRHRQEENPMSSKENVAISQLLAYGVFLWVFIVAGQRGRHHAQHPEHPA